MFTILFYGFVVLGIIMAIVAMTSDARVYWLAGFIMYFASFLGGYSIGLYLLLFPFIFWTLALAHTFRWIKKLWNQTFFIAMGIFFWVISINTIDDYWLFSPISWLL